MDGAGNEGAAAMSDASPQRRPRRREKQPESAGSDSELKKDRSKTARTKKRKSPPQASDDENRRDEKKPKVEQDVNKRTRAVAARSATANASKKGQEDEVSSDHGGTTDGDAAQTRIASRVARARRPASQRVLVKPNDKETYKEEPKVRRREPKQNPVPGRAREGSPELHPSRGHETDFGIHLARHQEDRLMTFDISTKALMETLKTAKHIDLATENIQICAECRGGGDLLCCDCCPLAFHPDCLEPLERPSSLYVPIAKHGLKSATRRLEEDQKEIASDPFRLKEAEWYCPYCMAPPIQKYWKRGVPQFLGFFEGSATASTPTDISEKGCGNVIQWMEEVSDFVNNSLNDTKIFPPKILLALAGIRRAIQRHGALYNMLSKREYEVRAEMEQASMVETSQDNVPLSDSTGEQAEPQVKAEILQKPNIMGRRNAKQRSDEDSTAPEIDQPRRSTRRGQVLESRKTGANKKEEVREELPAVQAKVNVGASFQVPGVNKHFLEAREFGLNYWAMDRQSVINYLPRDHLGRIPLGRLNTASACRLVYSATELEKRRQEEGENGQVPLSEVDLTEYVHKAITLWPVWIQWPPTQEFALKLLHHCRYDREAALRLLCSDALQFRAVCDPPVKPYMNKWKPRDKRGHLPSVPFPPPSNMLSLMGVPDLGVQPIP